MKNFTMRFTLNLILFILLLFFLIFSINIYLNNNHIVSNIAKKSVSIIEINIASKTKDLAISLGDALSEDMLGELFKSIIEVRSFEIRHIKSIVTDFDNFYLHNTAITVKVDSDDNNKFYESFEKEEVNSEKLLNRIFLNKTKTINSMNKEYKSNKTDTVISREELKKINQFEDIINDPLFYNCKLFKVSPKLSISRENNKSKKRINYSLTCLTDTKKLDLSKFTVDISLTPYYEDTFKKQSINSVYLVYVILTFLLGLLLFILNLSDIKLRFKFKSNN